jgi:hypothetical protein
MSTDAKLVEVTGRYLSQLLPIYCAHKKHHSPRTFFVDASLLRGNQNGLLSSAMLAWHIETAQFNHEYWSVHGRRLICRIVPLLKRLYSAGEIEKIKYNIHFQLTLGLEVLVIFLPDDTLLEKEFGIDNLAIVKKALLITDAMPYDPTVTIQISVKPWSDSGVEDLYYQIDHIEHCYESYLLRYNSTTFTSYRENLRRSFGEFLFSLQSGRCAISQEVIHNGAWDVDHIFPIGLGGNNSLVNSSREPSTKQDESSATSR